MYKIDVYHASLNIMKASIPQDIVKCSLFDPLPWVFFYADLKSKIAQVGSDVRKSTRMWNAI